MMPGGHLATSILLSGGAYLGTGSPLLAAGCFLGGFLIDVDHYADYMLFERQWRRPGPADFLRYYFRFQIKRVVLPLHSLELMAVLAGVALFRPHPLLVGYLAGAAMHLLLDVLVNGDHVLKKRVLFYSFIYRAIQNFSATKLMDKVTVSPETGRHPYLEFFQWRSPEIIARIPDTTKPRSSGGHRNRQGRVKVSKNG